MRLFSKHDVSEAIADINLEKATGKDLCPGTATKSKELLETFT